MKPELFISVLFASQAELKRKTKKKCFFGIAARRMIPYHPN
jgi:hypothetical protein